MKVYTNYLSHMTKMAATPIYGQNLLILLFQNQLSDGLETFYAALITSVLPSWLTLTFFNCIVKYGKNAVFFV